MDSFNPPGIVPIGKFMGHARHFDSSATSSTLQFTDVASFVTNQSGQFVCFFPVTTHKSTWRRGSYLYWAGLPKRLQIPFRHLRVKVADA